MRRRMLLPCLLFALLISFFYIFLIQEYSSKNDVTVTATVEKKALYKKDNQTVIILSLDGFRNEYLERNITPNLSQLINIGIRAKYMIPCFPVITFPNHFSMVTGLLPEYHGIVGNDFYAPDLKKTFTTRIKDSIKDPEFWKGTLIWKAAEKNGIKTMVQMWPGSDVKYGDSLPDYLELYNKLILPSRKINNILDKLDNPIELRPRLILSYFPEVDTVGHLLGSNSFVLDKTIKKVDKAIASLFNGLKKKNMLDEVNVIIVSDHGMSKIEKKNVIYLDDIIDLNTVRSIHMYPYAGLNLFDETTIDAIYEQLKEKERLDDLVKVFKRKQLFPSDNSRIPELILIPKRGYYFSIKKAVKHLSTPRHMSGIHGFNETDIDMHSIFIGFGPYFKQFKKELEPFRNIELFNLFERILSIPHTPNNGTLNFWP